MVFNGLFCQMWLILAQPFFFGISKSFKEKKKTLIIKPEHEAGGKK